jgi:hypothetical protein
MRASALRSLCLALVLGGGVVVGARTQEAAPPPTADRSAASAAVAVSSDESAVPVGWIDVPAADAIVGPRVELSGWAHARSGIARIEIRVGERRLPARIGLPRPDVAASDATLAGAGQSGWTFVHDFTDIPAPPGWDRRALTVVAFANDGGETVLGTRSLIEARAFTRWAAHTGNRGAAFDLLPALSGTAIGAASGLREVYAPYLSATTRVGMRVPVLYLRTTRGATHDYAFDPHWDIERRCGERRIADDSLAAVLDDARGRRLPLLVTLNGGIWADASCDVPQWDLNDRLEQDPGNCQWNANGAAMPDDWLRNLPGSQNSPELARALTLNVYAAEVRRYKKRNLQQAARLIAAFGREHPELLVGVNLDPDVYINPFFNETQWYDYNPGTLRQFRHWLAGTGPYQGRPEQGVPDLRRYRRAQPLTLAQVNAIAGRSFARFDEIDPPRAFPRTGPTPFWRDPWVREWEVFRRHLVALHYDELAAWLVEAGVPRDRIWTSQGFMAPTGDALPLAQRLDSPVGNYDSGGVSIEGSRPRIGHLGAIVYGASAVNAASTEDGRSLFATFAAFDRGWGAVEFNTAELREPSRVPGEAEGYRALRDLWNHGARFVSPMAWNGSNGLFAGQPGYVPYTSWRNTPAEEAARDFLLAHANLPRHARLWTFGTPRHADDDGWKAARGRIVAQPASLAVQAAEDGTLAIESPRELALAPRRGHVAIVEIEPAARVPVEVWGRAADANDWQLLGKGDARGVTLRRMPVETDQLKLALALPGGRATITRIAVIPK